MTTKSLDKRVRVSHFTTSIIIRELLDGPCSALELSIASGLHLVTVYELMRSMRKEKAAHIVSWEPDRLGRPAIAVFALGRGRDARRRSMSRATIAKRYRDRKRDRLMIATTDAKNFS